MCLQHGSSNSNANEIREFSEWILKVGDGIEGEQNDGEVDIELPDDILIKNVDDPIAAIVHNTYPSFVIEYWNSDYLQERAILAPTHEIVETINDYVLSLILADEKI
ncbi:uncharacterized protein LOC141638184 [Silene latifolia]|uniref:uncharacterized protein LOC141638184 n=1 Tax=Silene latifolia TaxID=37657 RepID=UPI003D780885